ncbi:MAG: GTPase domain-containing protein [Chthoniobacteraceae bacterium]
MKSEIHQFCTVCSQSLGTLPEALLKAATQFERGDSVLKGSLVTLNDLRARLRSLTDKLESQNAYLLIFGPLKSGKSTLMNAISGAYVSEVTSLPGYPCLVFVQDSQTTRYSVTRYNGRETILSSGIELKAVVEDAHPVLADRIRTAEEGGEGFDPGTNFPEAIRRVDIKVPVPALDESAMILVDTPGLYSRMNFGYDVLTREFRDGAACAVFVVKTDNLFLEQVFAEFNQLLGLFSRIFIVVNVDASKRDLAPDGSLRPSAESENPGRVVEAFKTLSMAGPMRTAYEAGRVRIHAVDLLSAASSILSRNGGTATPLPQFDTFQQDLIEYLNSSDYTREFIRDSLRQSRTLCDEMQAVIANGEVTSLRTRQDALGAEILALNARIAATDQLLQTDWNALFQPLREEIQRGAEDAVTARTAQMREEIRQGFTRWMTEKDSLVALPHLQWNPALTDAARSLAEETRARLARLSGTVHAGLELSSEMIADLKTAGFSPRESGDRALADARADEYPSSYKMIVQMEAIPVRKSFADWLLFRGRAKVRQRLFGADGNREIPAPEKERRLKVPSRAEFENQWENAIRERFPSKPVAFASKLADAYATGAAANILTGLRALKTSLASQRDARQTPFNLQSAILRSADDLQNQAMRVARDIELLAEKEDPSLASPPPIPPECSHLPDPGLLPSPVMNMLPLLGE